IIISNEFASTGIKLEGKTFDVYKVFDATVSDATISYTVNDAFENFFIEQGCTADSTEIDDEKAEAYIHAQDTTAKLTALASALRTEATNNAAITAVTTISGDVSTSGTVETMTSGLLDPGYYLIVDTSSNSSTMSAGMLVSLPEKSAAGAYTENVTIGLKGSQPEINKEVWHNDRSHNGTDNSPLNDVGGTIVAETQGRWDTVADYEIGDIVEYRITATLPTDVTAYDEYTYIISDTLTEGITYNSDSLKIYLDAELTTEVSGTFHDITNYTTGNKIFDLTIDVLGILGYYDQMNVFYIYYTGTVTDTAAVAMEKETNTVDLVYSNNPYVSASTGTDSASVTSYTFALDVTKTDSSGVTTLKDAVFGLFVSPASETEPEYQVYLVESETNVYVVQQSGTPDLSSGDGYITTDSTGKFTINGLDDATTYIIREVTAPDGYSKADDVSFKITADYTSGTPTITSSNTSVTVSNGKLSTTIKNTSSELFPGTGGTGSILFVISGSVLMLGAIGVFMVRSRNPKRKNGNLK
ncbi:MAG: SpaH/EbpB family LPXTG-anchored major pilin, partial [Eubacteriales bacterium]